MGRFSTTLSLFFEIKNTSYALLRVKGDGDKKPNFFFLKFLEFDQIHSRGVLSLLITNLDTKNLSDIQTRVYASIFSKKNSTLSFDVEIM